MPPKRTRLESGSSSNPQEDVEFDPHRFVSPIAASEYTRLKKKTIFKERGFKPTREDGELLAMIEERGWQAFCEEPKPVPMGIVREFYANAKIEKNGYAFVRGTMVDYRAETIRTLLGLPPRPAGAFDWLMKSRDSELLDNILAELCVPGAQWKFSPGTHEHVKFLSKDMNRYARAWHLFICANILPSSHTHEVTVERAILLWGILKEEYIDLGYALYRGMLRFMDGGTTGAIPHASIVARLCASVGITWGVEEQIQHPSAPITHASLALLPEWPGGTAHHRGLGYIIRDPEDATEEEQDDDHFEEPPPPPRQPRAQRGARVGGAGPSRVRTVMTSSQHRRMIRRVDAVHDRTARFATDLISVLEGMCSNMGFDPGWPTYGEHHPYPPPDSPPEEGDTTDD